MEKLNVRRLPVINKIKRMTGMLSLADVSRRAPDDSLSECVKSVSAIISEYTTIMLAPDSTTLPLSGQAAIYVSR